jgi:trans-2,3-dihydro-3-hydroxyanthranilate isomerase
MGQLAFHTLDVFTDRRFGGNPLAVIPDASGLDSDEMQQLAREFNLSETAFVLPPRTPDAARRVRIFTPAAELPFAGHPTVGAAALLVDLGLVGADQERPEFVFEEELGLVAVTVTRQDGRAAYAQLTAPEPPRLHDTDATTPNVASLLSLPRAAIGSGELETQIASAGVTFLVVPLSDPQAVKRAVLDRGVWREHFAGTDEQNIYVVSVVGEQVHARMFAPALGIDEDPATGAAATALGGYLTQGLGEGAHHWTVTQGVEIGRPSRLEVDVQIDGGGAPTVRVGGGVVRVADGMVRVGDDEIRLP